MVADECLEVLAKVQTLGWRDGPKDITPMAWKNPSLIVSKGVGKSPRDSFGTRNPCVTTVTKMTIILINASVLAFANYTSQLPSLI
jgi:hypothetical protein